MITHWNDLDGKERISFLVRRILGETDDGAYVLDANLIQKCEARLSGSQRTTYVKYMDSEIARLTYTPNMTEAEVRSDQTHVNFFWNYATASTELRGRILWHIFSDYEP